MNNNYKFVKTSDENTAQRLRDAGFPELAKQGNRWVFVNCVEKMIFSDDDKINFDNILTF